MPDFISTPSRHLPTSLETELFARLSPELQRELAKTAHGQPGWLMEKGRWQETWIVTGADPVLPMSSVAIMRTAAWMLGSKQATLSISDVEFRGTIPIEGHDALEVEGPTPRAVALLLLIGAEKRKPPVRRPPRLGDGPKGTTLKGDD